MHCTAATRRERETHRGAEEKNPVGGAGGQVEEEDTLVLFSSLYLCEIPLWVQVAIVQLQLNFTHILLLLLPTFTKQAEKCWCGDRRESGPDQPGEPWRTAGCQRGEERMEPGRRRVCGRCWRGRSWRVREALKGVRLPAAAWGTRWTATAGESTLSPKTFPEELRGCELSHTDVFSSSSSVGSDDQMIRYRQTGEGNPSK